MSEAFIGEIRAFGFNFAPQGWFLCYGQTLPISQYAALFSILGTTYGGNGTTNFQLPNLQGQSPMQWGTSSGLNTVIGEAQGAPTVTLSINEMPQHLHTIFADNVPSGSGKERTPGPTAGSYFAQTTGGLLYQSAQAPTTATFSPAALSSVGNSLPHDNMQPYLTINFCIACEGQFPTRG